MPSFLAGWLVITGDITWVMKVCFKKKGILYYIPFFCNSPGHQAAKEEGKSYKDTVYNFSHLFEILIPEALKHQMFLFYTSSVP